MTSPEVFGVDAGHRLFAAGWDQVAPSAHELLFIAPLHGIGGAKDLPISPWLAIAGGAAALQISFSILGMAWRHPRFDAATQGTPLPLLEKVVESRVWQLLVRGMGLIFTVYVVAAAVAGPDLVVNPVFGVVYSWLWVGLIPASLLFGPVIRQLSPLRTLHLLGSRVAGRDPEQGWVPMPARLGCWPAAVGLIAFTWLELASPNSTSLDAVRIWFLGYVVLIGGGAAVFGNRWFAAADPFEVYSTLVAGLSVFGRRSDGALVMRSPLRNLDGVPARPGLAAVVTVLFGSTIFDSFRDSVTWARFTTDLGTDPVVVNSLGLLIFCMVTAGLFAVATWATPARHLDHESVRAPRPHRDDDPGQRTPRRLTPRWGLPNVFAHSVIPIVVGYMTAHYLSYFVTTGQQTLTQLSDPFVDGANLLGTANLGTSFWLVTHTTTLALIKVAAIIGGHVVGVIAAHDRALKVLPTRDQLTGQLPLLFVMVAFTCAGLWLLFGA